MLPKRLRLPRSGFRAPKTARRAVLPHISLVFYPADPKKSGMAVVIPKKAAAKAVDRHRVKRQLLSLMRSWRLSDTAAVVYARTGITDISFAELKGELAALYARLPAK